MSDRRKGGRVPIPGIKTDIVEAKSGAKTSGNKPFFYLLPQIFLTRVANRFKLGAPKYGEWNYEKCISNRRIDVKYVKERYDHAFEHLTNLTNIKEDSSGDDNLAALGWFVAFACVIEAKTGVSIIKILTSQEEFINY